MQFYKGNNIENFHPNEAYQIAPDPRETFQIVSQENYQIAPPNAQFKQLCNSCQYHNRDSASPQMYEAQDDSLCSKDINLIIFNRDIPGLLFSIFRLFSAADS